MTTNNPPQYLFVRYIDGQWLHDKVAAADLKIWCKTHGVRQIGVTVQEWLRPELLAQPIFDGFAGPMDGDRNIIRYEDWRANQILSS